MKKIFKIKGLDCANCAMELERAIKKINGVNDASLSFMTEKLVLDCKEDKIDEIVKDMKKVIRKEETDVEVKEIQ